MHIGIYTLFLTPGQIGGIETYLHHLIKYLAKVDRDNHYTLFVTLENRHLFANLPDNFKLIQISLLPPGPFIIARLMHKLGHLPAYAARQMQRHPLDLLHYPGSTIDQPAIKVPCVLTLHDIQHEYHPDFFDPATLHWRRTRFAASAQKARHIITDAEFTRQTVIEKLGVSPNKVHTIHLGVDKIFNATVIKQDYVQFQKKYNLPEKFLFYPANPWPHKNHGRLLQALALLKQQRGLRCPLVLSGVWSEEERLKQQIQQFEVGDQVQVLGHVPYEALPLLYARATALVFPSLFEGFGLPVLEAMACGCPVICSNTTSLPELAGEAALVVDPLDVAQMAEAIYNTVTSNTLRRTLQAKGFKQVKNFSWEQAARKTVKVYESTQA